MLKGDNKEYSHLMTEDNKTSVNNTYKYTFSELPKYDAKGDKITYVLSEKNTGSIFYTLENAKIDQDTMTVTNKFVIPDEKNPIEVTKVWDDNNDAAGKRSTAKAELVLKGDNKEYSHLMTEDNKTSVNNTYKYTFSELPKYDAKGDKITYVLSEKNTGSIFYTLENAKIDQDTMTVTNKFVVPDEKNSITVTKIWDDNGNAPINGEDKKGPRPDTINIVFKGGKEDIDKKLTGTGNTWSESYSLPKYNENGNPITYTIDEESTSLDWYVKSIDPENYIITNSIPDLEITKKIVSLNGEKLDDNTEVSVVEGDVIGYEITVENIGNVDLTNVTVVDEMTNGNAIYENYDKTTNTVSNKIKNGIVAVIPELKTKSKPVSYLVYYEVTNTDVSDASKSIDNTATATVKYTDVTGKEKEIDRFDEASAQVQDISKIEVEKTQSVNGKKLDKDEKNTKVTPGTVINYTIKVSNVGNTKQENVIVTDTMNNLSKKSYEIKSITVNGTARKCTISEDGIVIGNLEIGEEAVITISYTVDESDMTTTVGEIKNTVTVNKTNPDGTTPTDEVKVPTEEWKADIDVVKSSKLYRDGKEISGPAMYGDTIRYTITATNTGRKQGTIDVTDGVPEGTTLKTPQGKTNLTDAELTKLANGKEITRTLIVPGNDGTKDGTADIYFEVIVEAKPGEQIKNMATASDGTKPEDSGHNVEKKVSVKMNTQIPTIKNSNVVIVIDKSGSMKDKKVDYKGQSKTRLEVAKIVVKDFIDTINLPSDGTKGSAISIVTFNGPNNYNEYDVGTKYTSVLTANNKTISTTANDAKKLKEAVDGIKASNGTVIAGSLTKAKDQIEAMKKIEGYKNNNNIVIFIGDGDPDGDYADSFRIPEKAQELKDTGATVYAIGFGQNVNILKNTVASEESKYYTTSDNIDLSDVFTKIGTEIGEPTTKDVESINGLIELPGIDVNKDITIKLNGETTGKTGKVDLFGDKIKNIDGKYYLDTSKFDADAKIEIEYFEVESK